MAEMHTGAQPGTVGEPMPPDEEYLADITERIGQELGTSDWLAVEQQMIQQFADCTGDRQWIHVDIERARQESPLGTTIAHGFLVLSLLPQLFYKVDIFPDSASQSVNYGIDRLRFITPVKAGNRIRSHMTLVNAEKKGDGRILLRVQATVEIEGEDKPALIAELLSMLIF